MNKTAVKVGNLCKSYGKIKAVDGISFDVCRGEIFGLVGSNGAGKTTAIECLEGLRRPDSGTIEVLGLNPTTNGRALRNFTGIQLQESQLPARIKVWEAMSLFSSFYTKTIEIAPLLEDLGLKEKKNSYFDKLSGGQKQRLFIALSLLNDPELIFLDELTTGFCPTSRTAQAVGMAIAFPMMFLSGSTIPLEVLPEKVINISKYLPPYYVVTLMRGLWAGDSLAEHGLK